MLATRQVTLGFSAVLRNTRNVANEAEINGLGSAPSYMKHSSAEKAPLGILSGRHNFVSQ